MKKTVIKISSLMAALALAGCSSAPESRKVPVVNIAGNFSKTDFDNLSGSVVVEAVCRPEFTDSTMLDTPDLLYVANGIAYINEDMWLSRFDFTTGQSIGAFNHTGQGPEEYSSLWQAAYNPAIDKWGVIDSNRIIHSILEYTSEGDFVMRAALDSVGDIAALSDGGWLAINNDASMEGGFHKVKKRKIYRFTPDWKQISTYTLAEERWDVLAQSRLEELLPINGELYITDGDTICRYDEATSTLVKSIVLDLGDYSYPWGTIKDLEELREVEKNHFNINNPVFNSRYIFATYYLHDDSELIRFDVYRLTDGELVYRHTSTYDEHGGFEQFVTGFPVKIEGTDVYGWPMRFVSDDSFYMLIPSDEMCRISDDEEVNPSIVKCKFKIN